MDHIGIMGAMNVEIQNIQDKMENVKEENIAGFSFYVGRIGEKNVVLTCCGVGKVNAAACTQILIDRFGVNCIINTGVAGGLYSDIKTCDIVISTDVTHHDVSKNQLKTLFPFKEHFESDKYLVEIAIKSCEMNKIEGWNYYLGRIVSGECFVNDGVLKKRIIEEYSPYCVEMEGAAIGHVAYLNNVPFVVIRSISDKADENASMSYESFEKVAASQSAKIVLSMIDMI